MTLDWMMLIGSAGLMLGPVAVAHGDQAGAAATPRAVHMDVARENGQVAVSIVGKSETPRVVGFKLAVEGASTTHNAARSRLGPRAQTMSVVRFPDRAPWRVTIDVDEEGRESYRLSASSDDVG